MKIETAVKMLIEEHAKARSLEFVHKPVAYALYHVWKYVDEHEKPRSIEKDSKK